MEEHSRQGQLVTWLLINCPAIPVLLSCPGRFDIFLSRGRPWGTFFGLPLLFLDIMNWSKVS